MTVLPSRANLFQDPKELYRVLSGFQQLSEHRFHPQIVSISQGIPKVDPLAVLAAFSASHQRCFYWENPRQQEAIAAIDTALIFQTNQSNRFVLAQDFIQTTLDQLISLGDYPIKATEPHFFCNFTFFDDPPFAHSPFPAATVFLPRLQVSRQGDRTALIYNLELHPHTPLQPLIDTLCQHYQTLLKLSNFSLPTASFQSHSHALDIHRLSDYKARVLSVLNSIQDQSVKKVVLAQALEIITQPPFNLTQSLANLRKTYPDCYVFLTSNGNGNHFIGASPERLMSVKGLTLETDAIAGSAPRGKTPSEDHYLAHKLLTSEKELREHQFVTEFITQSLINLGLSPQHLPIPQLLQLSNIQHLWTPIHSQLNPQIHPLNILSTLHPTPAVAGTPRDIACEHIRHYEPFDRSLYAAPIGWIDRQGNSEFVVGIRSALMNGNQAILYAGAGIVAGSNPDQEIMEIKLKLQALLKALV